MTRLVLASSSPRRKELLEKAGFSFIVDASSIEEVMDEALPVKERLQALASMKAFPIHQKYPDDVVMGADTVVYFQNHIIGKAHNEQEARRILMQLSSSQHIVYTAVAIYYKNELYTFIDETKVQFKNIENMIDDYIASLDWVGKAGAYGIQGRADQFVEKIIGDKDNVIGLPIKKVICFMEEHDIHIK